MMYNFKQLLKKLKGHIVFLQLDATATSFSLLSFQWLLFEGGIYFFGKPTDINNGLKKVHISNTATTVRRCQQFVQRSVSPTGSAVKNEWYNTNKHTTSLVTNYSHMCAIWNSLDPAVRHTSSLHTIVFCSKQKLFPSVHIYNLFCFVCVQGSQVCTPAVSTRLGFPC